MANRSSQEPRPDHRSDLEKIARTAMIERGFLPDFSAAVRGELAEALAVVDPASLGARDLRQVPWISIDNDDSRDIDQLTASEPLANGTVRVRVAVADVAGVVRCDSAIDTHARHNTTSVYTVPRVFSMLPLELSTDRTSLNQGCVRLAVVVEFEVDARGMVGFTDTYPALVTNRAQLAYPSVGAWLEGVGPAPAPVAAEPVLAEQLRIQDEVARLLEERRREEGALNVDTRSPRAIYDDGRVTDIVEGKRSRATKLIEEFMVAANGVIGRFLASHGPSIQRVVRRPRNWPRLREVAAHFKESLPPQPDGVALGRFLARRRRAAPDAFQDLSLVVIKLLGRGEYVVGGEAGHFGLGVHDYSHSTAPNRRFPDLVTQRLLLAVLSGSAPPYDEDSLRAIAAHCTAKEADAEKVERKVRKSAAALFLHDRIGERFDAIVTGSSERGTWVRIRRPPVEGRLVASNGRLRVGHHLRVELVRADVERGYIDFEAPWSMG